MPQAVAIPIITGAATIGAGALAYAGAKGAQGTQEKSSQAALDFAKQQEAERIREWNAQQEAAKYAWQVQQANLAPYRAARAAVLARYGINANVETPPMPASFTAGTPPVTPPQTGPRLVSGGPNPTISGPAPPGATPMLGKIAQIAPGALSNWADWANYGVPKA